ncbi:putative cytochrome P450 12a4, mitochondrial, partial [Armadillidium vulgare]
MFELISITTSEFHWWKYIYSPSYNKLKKEHEYLLSVVLSNVVEAEKELKRKINEGGMPEDPTLLETFLQTDGLTRKDVVTFMLDMFFAGIDTTSHTLGFTLYLLARNKEKQKKLQEELDLVLGDGKEILNEKQLGSLTYLKACVKESLRLFPLLPAHVRILQEDAVLGGYKIPKGHVVGVPTLTSGRDEKNFKQSNEFIPERWMRDRPLGQIHPFASIPFSHGTRMCIGR